MNTLDNKNLRQDVKNLHTLSGQFNLYICLCYNEHNADAERLKSEIKKIKELATKIEREINHL